MTTETRAQLTALTAAVQLVDVRLVMAQVRTLIRDPESVSKPQMVLSHDTEVINRKEDSFIVGAQLVLRVVPGNHGEIENPPVSMTIAYTLQYHVPNVPGYSEETLNEFARVNGTFNAWPYWREYVQSTSARMNLPPLLLPVFRVSTTSSDSPSPSQALTKAAQIRRIPAEGPVRGKLRRPKKR